MTVLVTDRGQAEVGKLRSITWIVVAYFVLLATTAVYLAIAWPFNPGVKVTRDEFGPAWPLTVSDGDLRCEAGREITFQRRGTTYSLNRRTQQGAHSDVTPIVADAPSGGKKDLSPLIDRGTSLCR